MQRGYMYHGPSQWTEATNNRWYISYTQNAERLHVSWTEPMDNDYKQQMVHQLYTAKNAERLHVPWTEPMDSDNKQQMVHQLYTAKNAERLHVSRTEPMDRSYK